MRVIYTLNDQKKGLHFSTFLMAKGIENQLEISTNQDWGSPYYGDATCRIWVYDEDQVPKALELIDFLDKNPGTAIPEKGIEPEIVYPSEIIEKDRNSHRKQSRSTGPKTGVKISWTSYLILICCLLFFVDQMTSPREIPPPKNLPSTPFLSSPLKKATLYDYPKAYTLIDKAIKLYGADALETPLELPLEGQKIVEEFYKTPYWHGFYLDLVHSGHFENEKEYFESSNHGSVLFEKIREGEIWRLFTPCLMHNDILHILFNMLWLVVLGKQIESRQRPGRYLLFIFITGIFSNTCQYLMSGSDFLGFSGVLCAMLTFIWVRQRTAAWEGYPLEKSTIMFMMVFIVAMTAIQLGSFFLENQYHVSVSSGIANTAHLSGALIGACLAYLPCFAWNWDSQKR